MTIATAIKDYQGSFLLGEADAENWLTRAHPNEVQVLALLCPEDIGQPDVTDRPQAPWLGEISRKYEKRDPRFHNHAYLAGFISTAQRMREQEVPAT